MPSKAASLLLGGAPGVIQGGGLSLAERYQAKWVATSPVAMWLLNEAAGTTMADSVNSPAQDATISGATYTLAGDTAPDGIPAVQFTGDSDGTEIECFSATLATALGNPTEITMACWVKPVGAAFYTTNHVHGVMDFYADANTRVRMFKDWSGNAPEWNYEAENWGYTQNNGLSSSTAWLLWFIQASDSGNVWRCGALKTDGTAQWQSGEIAMTHTAGAAFTQAAIGNLYSGSESFYGSLSRATVWDSYLTLATLLSLATVA